LSNYSKTSTQSERLIIRCKKLERQSEVGKNKWQTISEENYEKRTWKGRPGALQGMLVVAKEQGTRLREMTERRAKLETKKPLCAEKGTLSKKKT